MLFANKLGQQKRQPIVRLGVLVFKIIPNSTLFKALVLRERKLILIFLNFDSHYSALRFRHFIGRHFEMGHHISILSLPFVFPFKMGCRIIGVHLYLLTHPHQPLFWG